MGPASKRLTIIRATHARTTGAVWNCSGAHCATGQDDVDADGCGGPPEMPGESSKFDGQSLPNEGWTYVKSTARCMGPTWMDRSHG